MSWDSLVTYDLKFCMMNRLLNTSNFVLLKGCDLLACRCVKYFDTGNLADWLLYLASEIFMVISRNLHVIILQIPDIHHAKCECCTQNLLFPACTCYVTHFHKLFCSAPALMIHSVTMWQTYVWNVLPLVPTVPPVPPERLRTISSAANVNTTNFFAYV